MILSRCYYLVSIFHQVYELQSFPIQLVVKASEIILRLAVKYYELWEHS